MKKNINVEFTNIAEKYDLDGVSAEHKIELNKKISKHIKDAERKAKPDSCVLCGKKCSSFCNSHSIPRFVLKNTTTTGEFYNANQVFNILGIKSKVGVNEANTFKIICPDCDKKYFKTYENPSSYLQEPTQQMLAEIALKINLKMLSKRLIENENYKNAIYLQPVPDINTLDHVKRLIINHIDINDFNNGIKKAITTIQSCVKNYYLIEHMELNYKTKLVFQGQINLIAGFNGEIINNIYTLDKNYKIQPLYLCIFPIENTTHILLFIENGDTRCSKFYKRFKKLSIKQKLEVLNYVILKYSEDWLLDASVDKTILQQQTLKEVLKENSDPKPYFSNGDITEREYKMAAIETAAEKYTLNNVPPIVNLLDNI